MRMYPDRSVVPPRARRRRLGLLQLAGLGVAALVLTVGCSEETRSQIGDALGDTTVPADTGGDTGGTGGGDTGGGDTGDTGGGDTGDTGDTGGGDTGDTGGGDTGDTGGTAPAPESGNDESFSTGEWVLLIALGIGVVAIIIGATSAASHHSQEKGEQRRELARRLDDVTGGSRWVHDQSLSVLQASDPSQLQDSWSTVRTYMIDLETKIAALASGTGDSPLGSSLDQLGRAVAGLRSALGSYATVRMRPDADRQLVEAAMQTVMQRRQQLEGATQVVASQRP